MAANFRGSMTQENSLTSRGTTMFHIGRTLRLRVSVLVAAACQKLL